jgi:hypothetical protein
MIIAMCDRFASELDFVILTEEVREPGLFTATAFFQAKGGSIIIAFAKGPATREQGERCDQRH